MRAQWQDKDRLKAKHERQQGKEIVMAEKALQRAAREADREEESLRAQQQVLSTRLAPTVTAAVVYKKEVHSTIPCLCLYSLPPAFYFISPLFFFSSSFFSPLLTCSLSSLLETLLSTTSATHCRSCLLAARHHKGVRQTRLIKR